MIRELNCFASSEPRAEKDKWVTKRQLGEKRQLGDTQCFRFSGTQPLSVTNIDPTVAGSAGSHRYINSPLEPVPAQINRQLGDTQCFRFSGIQTLSVTNIDLPPLATPASLATQTLSVTNFRLICLKRGKQTQYQKLQWCDPNVQEVR